MCWADGQWGGLKPELVWIDPVETLRAMMKNPALKQTGSFAYHPEFANDTQFETVQLHHSAWFHMAQTSIGKENMVLAVATNCDGTGTTSQKESIFFYMRLANATAPGCFAK